MAILSGPLRSNGTRVRSSIGAKILSRWAAIATRLDLPDAPDGQCRYLEATVKGMLLASAGGRSQGIEEPYTSSKADPREQTGEGERLRRLTWGGVLAAAELRQAP
jgi:hypothetical protein